jgi:protein-tyrosine phosphatase
MIDLHLHLLPGLDDGAKTIDESIQMCRISYRDGVRKIVATPHTLNGSYINDRETILTKVRELNEALIQCGMQDAEYGMEHSKSEIGSSPVNSALKILPGADVHLCEKTLPYLDQGKVMTVCDGKKYLFLEFPSQMIPYQAENIMFQLMTRGITPIITHPERNLEIGQRPQRYYEMIRMGCLGQVTAMSLTGEFGSRVKRIAERLVKKRLVHFIASDGHSINGRAPILSESVRAAAEIVGEEEAEKMVTQYPRAILEGRKPDILEPLAP